MALRTMSGCSRAPLCAVVILIFLVKPQSVSCSRPSPGASVFHLVSSWYQKQEPQRLLYPSSPPLSVPVQHTSSTISVEHLEPQMSTPFGNADNMEDQGLDSELQRHSKLETMEYDREKGFRRPPSFQMLPRNTRPPPRGPSPGSNSVGNP